MNINGDKEYVIRIQTHTGWKVVTLTSALDVCLNVLNKGHNYNRRVWFWKRGAMWYTQMFAFIYSQHGACGYLHKERGIR